MSYTIAEQRKQFLFGEMKKFFFLLMSLTLCFSSCSKEEKDDPIIDEPTTHSHKGHEYVDLGLPSGLLWATCNVGANKPEDYGDYFAWAETSVKSHYTWTTLKYCLIKSHEYDYEMTKYCTNADYGKVDNKKDLESSDDAAQVNWGGKWRMPTKEETEELINECTWIWTSQNGVNGIKFTSKKNGMSIFFPAAGRCGGDDDLLEKQGVWLSYWTSSLKIEEPDLAHGFGYNADLEDDFPSCGASIRLNGRTIRPICKL